MALYEYSDTARRIVRSEIREMLKWSRRADTISFGGGLPDPALFPVAELEDIQKIVLDRKGYLALNYGPTPGEPEALEAFARHLSTSGDAAVVENLCVTSSSQQALDLIALLLIDPGSPVIVEIPSYVGGLQAFGRAGADFRGVPLGIDGMDLDALEEELLRLDREQKRPRLIYTIPDFQNPAGVTMSLANRRRLLEIASARGILVIEDSPYRELAFNGKALPSLWSLSGGQGVVLLKTLSKMLFPGFRLGWLAAEPEVADKLIVLKQSVDLCTSSFVQLVAAEYFNRGLLEGTIERARTLYRPKRDAMLAGLDKALPPGSTRSEPSGGVFLWATLPEGWDSTAVLKRGLELGVAFVTGGAFHCDGGGQRSMRLNFSFPSIEAIGLGCERLGAAIAEVGQTKKDGQPCLSPSWTFR
jgi:2-aminoadipate transaminase